MKLSRAEVPTERAVSYLRQLSRHWAHRFPVELADDGSHSKIMLTQAVCNLMASPTALSIYLEVEAESDQDRMEHVLEEHLQRFGFREPLDLRWLRS